jgi:hypothetical protein
MHEYIHTHHTIPSHTISYHTISPHTTAHHIIPYHTILDHYLIHLNLHCIALHCITLHYITLHDIVVHTHVCIYIYVCVCVIRAYEYIDMFNLLIHMHTMGFECILLNGQCYAGVTSDLTWLVSAPSSVAKADSVLMLLNEHAKNTSMQARTKPAFLD